MTGPVNYVGYSIGSRLISERMRLNLSVAELARVAGKSESSVIRWENDVSAPNAKVLTAWAKVGVDVLYLATGRQTPRPILSMGTCGFSAVRRSLEQMDPAHRRRFLLDLFDAELEELPPTSRRSLLRGLLVKELVW